MNIEDLKENTTVENLKIEVLKGETKEFNSGKRIQKYKIKDSDTVLVLWDADIDALDIPDGEITIINGWCKMYRGSDDYKELQIIPGKFGKLKIQDKVYKKKFEKWSEEPPILEN